MPLKKSTIKKKGSRNRTHKYDPLIDDLCQKTNEDLRNDPSEEDNAGGFGAGNVDSVNVQETEDNGEADEFIFDTAGQESEPKDSEAQSTVCETAPPPTHQTKKVFDRLDIPYSEECPTTPFQILALLMNMADRAHMANATRDLLLRIVSLLFPKAWNFPSSFDQLKSCLRDRDLIEEYINFFICPNCNIFITETTAGSSTFVCSNTLCGTSYDKKVRPVNFVYLPVEAYIKHAIEAGIVITSSKISLMKSKDGFLRSFADGTTYSKIEKEMGDQEFICVTLSSDDAQTALSSTANVWIGQIAIAQPDELSKPRVHAILSKSTELMRWWVPPVDLVQKVNSPIVSELERLGVDGINVVVDGICRNIKVRVLCYGCDSKERGPVLGIGSHNATFGCCHCEIPATQFKTSKGSKKIYTYSEKLKENDRPFRDSEATRILAKRAAKFHRRIKKLKRLNEKAKLAGLKQHHVPKNKKFLAEAKNVQHPTVLSRLPGFDEFRQTPVEPMHNGAEGVCKMFIQLTIPVKNVTSPWRLSDEALDETCAMLLSLTPPSKLQRHFRPMVERVKGTWRPVVNQWKMNELHPFGLMAALPTYYGRLKPEQFSLLARFVAISQYIYGRTVRKSDYKILLEDMLRLGIDLQKSVSSHYMTYNLHQWTTHFLKYVFIIGPPRTFWAFENESLIGICGRRQKQHQNIQKEIMGKTTLAECSKRLEEKYLKRETLSADLRPIVQSVCHTLKGSKLTVTTAAGKVYCFGAHETLTTYMNRNPTEVAMKNSLATQLEEPLENYRIWIYRSCRTEKGVTLRGDLTEGKAGVALKRDDSAFIDGEGRVYKAKRVVIVRKKSSHESEGIAYIYGLPAASVEWHEFGLKDDPVLKKEIYRGFYRCFKWQIGERTLKNAAECQESVFVMKNDLINGISGDALLGIPLFPFMPS